MRVSFKHVELHKWTYQNEVTWEGKISANIDTNNSNCQPIQPTLLACLLTYLFAYLLTYLLTYLLMDQSPSEANWFIAIQEISRILLNPKVHYHIHNCPPPVSILSQPNPLHTPHQTFWRSTLILSSHLRLGLPSGLVPSGFPTKTLYTPLSFTILATCPAHLILFDFITRTISGEEYRSLSFHYEVFSTPLLPRPAYSAT
jgi:hypothetical protein